MTAVGQLALRPLKYGLSGTLRLDGRRIDMFGSIRRGVILLTGNGVRGELRAAGVRHVGVLRRGVDRFTLEGAWDEDAQGRVLTCVVGEAVS